MSASLAAAAAASNMAAPPLFGNPSIVQLTDLLDNSIDAKLGRNLSAAPAHLSRVVYVPKHTDNVTHLPLYDVTETYFEAVQDELIGSSKYKLRLAMMKRPTGDGTHGEVRYLADYEPGVERTIATIERRVPTHNGEVVRMSLPRVGDQSFHVESLNAAQTSRLSLTPIFPIQDTVSKEGPVRHPWFAISHRGQGEKESHTSYLEWQIHPKEHGPLRYTLVDSGVESASGEPTVHAIYHHVGISLGLPSDYSEGVLLVSEDLNAEAEALAVATLLGLLHQARHLNQPAPKPRKKSLVKRVLGKI